jgi:hypothetical protein
MHGPELLVAGHDLDCLPLGLGEKREVADDVEQVCGAEHPGDEGLLARRF